MNALPKVLAATAILLAASLSSYGAVIDQVIASDGFYTPFSGTINSGDTGVAATLDWDSAVFGAVFIIDFTNGAGIITDVLFSDAGHDSPEYAGDSLEFDGFLSGNSAIGTPCIAGPTTACLQTTGEIQDVTALIGSLNGIGICCGTSDVSILADDAVPEPTSLILLGIGLASFSLIRRRKTA